MNAKNERVFYQDLKTNPGDVIFWSLEHSVRAGGAATQAIKVSIGKPNGTPSGESANIDTTKETIFQSTGITGAYALYGGKETTGDSLAALSLSETGHSSSDKWATGSRAGSLTRNSDFPTTSGILFQKALHFLLSGPT